MTEVRKESLSALIDGEASELEVHRLVREFRQDTSLSISWARYQHIRTTIQSTNVDRPGAGALRPSDHEKLLNRISEAIAEEETHSHSPGVHSRTSTRHVLAGSLALAASLVVAVFIGVQQPEDQAAPGLAGTPDSVEVTPVAVQPVANGQADLPTHELVELDEEKQRLLRNYLNQHDRMARMNDNRQFVNYQENTSK